MLKLLVNFNFKYYILYYILILIKSFLLIICNILKNKKLYYYIYIYLLLIYIKFFYIYNNNQIFNIFLNFNYLYFFIYQYIIDKFLFYSIKNYIYNKNKYYLLSKIINIQKVSYTIKKGRIKRYKIILVIGSKFGWIGIGLGKSTYLNKAIILAKIHALNNIYYFKYSLIGFYKLKYIYVKTRQIFLKLQINLYNFMNIKYLLYKYLLECIGYLNYKIIIYYSRYKTKYKLLYTFINLLCNLYVVNV